VTRQTAYALPRTRLATSEVVGISVATGRVSRVLASGPTAASAAPMSMDGSSLLVSLSLAHVRHPTTGGQYVGHLARIDLVTGQIMRLPVPLYQNPQAPPPPLLAAW
jgi:hypothetical protein